MLPRFQCAGSGQQVKLRTQMHLQNSSCAASPEFVEMPKPLAKKNGNFSVPFGVPFANISSGCGISKSEPMVF
jgi:hypothetical protein